MALRTSSISFYDKVCNFIEDTRWIIMNLLNLLHLPFEQRKELLSLIVIYIACLRIVDLFVGYFPGYCFRT